MQDKSAILKHYSISSIGSFKSCPRKWWMEKVLGLTLPSSEAASFGNQYDELITHRLGLEACDTRSFDNEKPIMEQELCAGVEDAVAAYMIQPFAVKKGETSHAQKKITIAPHVWTTLAEDLGLCLEIDKPITGYIDHIKKEGLRRVIVDQKTSKRKGMRFDWVTQLIVYALAENARSAEVHLMTRTKVPSFYCYPILINEDTKRAVMTNFTYYANAIQAALKEGSGENLARNPDYWCAWCPDKLECPANVAISL